MKFTSLWHSIWMPRVLTVIAVVLGLPMFLRMPPWVDITLYDMAARTILSGGSHYRDVFDTNPPGFVWALTAIRFLFGPSYEALWIVDLVIVAGIVLLVDRLARWGGATRATRWWTFAGIAFFYPFSTEGVHAQRDVWLSLPALLAVLVRVRRTRPNVPQSGRFEAAMLEGILWGLAVWVKPHVMVMAAGVWLLTIRRLSGERFWRNAAVDFAGNIAGGLIVGLAGLTLLYASGSWSACLDVFTTWNQSYTSLIRRELEERYKMELHWFPPWSLLLIPTIPLALISVLDAKVWCSRGSPASGGSWVGRYVPKWLYDPGADDSVRFVRAVLGGCYLLWAAQALYLQRGFQYVHVTETFLMFGLWAAHRWVMPAAMLLWIAATSGLWLVADAHPPLKNELLEVAFDDLERDHYLIRHPLADPARMRRWPSCWRMDYTATERGQLRDALKHVRHHEASIGWEELEEVAEFLRSQPGGVKDHEVIAWHDSPHAIYLILGIKPGIRFMHVYTIRVIGPEAESRMYEEMEAALPRARFIVGDLQITTLGFQPNSAQHELIAEAGVPGDLLPPRFDDDMRARFPFTHRTVFRSGGGSGRYVVFKADELVPHPVQIPNFGPGMKPVLDFLRQP